MDCALVAAQPVRLRGRVDADGTGAAWYRRDRERFADIVRRSAPSTSGWLRQWESSCTGIPGRRGPHSPTRAWTSTWSVDGDS